MKLSLIGGAVLSALALLASGAAAAQKHPRGTIDENGDGVVDFSELQAVHPDLTIDEFNKMDASRDGQLTRDELDAAFAARMMKRLDTDGDGAISPEEMEAFGPPRPDVSGQLQKFDADGDGKLSQSEFTAMHEEMRKQFGGRRGPPGRPRPDDDSD